MATTPVLAPGRGFPAYSPASDTASPATPGTTDYLAPPRSKDLGSAPQPGVGTPPPSEGNGSGVVIRVDQKV